MAAAEAEVVSPLILDTYPDTSGSAAASVATAVAAAASTGSQAQVSKAALAAKLMSLSGVFAVQKPKGPTSAELLNRLKEKLLAEAGMPSPERNKRQKQTLKVGHGGTLDSAAQGVLGLKKKIENLENKIVKARISSAMCSTFPNPGICFPATAVSLASYADFPSGWDWKRNKNVDQYVVGVQGEINGAALKNESLLMFSDEKKTEIVYLACSKDIQNLETKIKRVIEQSTVDAFKDKRYIAIGELGKATDTMDSTGKVTEEKPYDKITQEDIEGILQKFTGNIMQVPPLYSALKKDGQRLSTLMKRGKAVEARPARPVTVHSISLLKFQPPFFTLDVECGGGFYIRSLVSDIGKELSSCARVLELTRTKQGPFTLAQHALPEDRWTIDDIARSLEPCTSSLLPEELTFKKSRSEDSGDQVLSCGYVTLREAKGEDDAAKTL